MKFIRKHTIRNGTIRSATRFIVLRSISLIPSAELRAATIATFFLRFLCTLGMITRNIVTVYAVLSRL